MSPLWRVDMPDPRSFLPLTHHAYSLLLCLAEEPAHGYALVERIRSRSGGLISPGTGSFYSIVKKLNEERLIEEVEAEPGDRRRRLYRLTALGAKVLQAEANRLESNVEAARRLRSAWTGRGADR